MILIQPIIKTCSTHLLNKIGIYDYAIIDLKNTLIDYFTDYIRYKLLKKSN